MSCSLPVHDGLKFQFLSKRPLIVDNQVQNLAQIMLPLNQIYNYPCCHRHNQRLIHKPPENNYALIGKGKDTASTIRSLRSAPAKNRGDATAHPKFRASVLPILSSKKFQYVKGRKKKKKTDATRTNSRSSSNHQQQSMAQHTHTQFHHHNHPATG